MGKIAKLNGARVAKYKRNLAKWALNLTPAEIERAAQWYPETLALCYDIAKVGSYTIEQAASIFSAYSPRVQYKRNVALAYRHARGEQIDGLAQSRKTALKAESIGLKALNGPKTQAFARNILGDCYAVTVDTWHCKAAGLITDSPTIVQYREISRATQLLAMDLGLEPSTLQALIWVRIRGKAD
jgi:hypothetical protein